MCIIDADEHGTKYYTKWQYFLVKLILQQWIQVIYNLDLGKQVSFHSGKSPITPEQVPKCHCVSAKPKLGGRAVTEDTYLDDILSWIWKYGS